MSELRNIPARPTYRGKYDRKDSSRSTEPLNARINHEAFSKYPSFAKPLRTEPQFFTNLPDRPLVKPSGDVLNRYAVIAIPEIKISEAIGINKGSCSPVAEIHKDISSGDTFDVKLDTSSRDTSQSLSVHSNVPPPRSTENGIRTSSVKKKPVPSVMLQAQGKPCLLRVFKLIWKHACHY